MGILLTLLLGGLAGFIASKILNRDQDMGVILNIVLGIVGAFLANWLLAPIFDASARLDTLSLSGFLMSVLGAIVVLGLYNLVTLKRVQK